MDKITVGSLLDPRPHDAEFPNLDAAMIDARKWAEKDPHFAIAVWTGHTLYRVLLRGFELIDINNDERW